MDTCVGNMIDTTHAVFIAYEEDARGFYSIATLCEEDCGDRAVVVATTPCDEHGDCDILTVAPDDSETLEYVHAFNNIFYAVETL